MSKEKNKNGIECEQTVEIAAQKTAKPQEATLVSELLKDLEDELTPEQEISLAEIFKQSENPEEDPKVLEKVIALLEGWGFSRIDNDRSTIVAEAETDRKAAEINELVTKGKMPTTEYKSNVGLYGFKVKPFEGGILYIKPLGAVNKIENRLRVSGDRGGKATDFFRKGVRRRANLNETNLNIKELGLKSYFTYTPEGIIETTKDISTGFMLTDLLGEKNRKESKFLQQFDPREAVKEASKMIAHVHSNSERGIGEVLTNDIVFGVKQGKMEAPRLSIPDIVFNKDVDKLEQQATDMLDFLFSVGSTCHTSTGEIDLDLARSYIKAVFEGYNFENSDLVKKAMKSLNQQGRPFLTLHNGVRLGFDRVKEKKTAFEQIRGIILEEVK